MDLKALKSLVVSKDWKSSLLFILENDISTGMLVTYTSEYYDLKSNIIEEFCFLDSGIEELLSALQKSKDKNILLENLVSLFVKYNKFDSAFLVIAHAISSIDACQVFYRQKINLHSKLEERQKAHDTAKVYCELFPKQSYGYLKLIQTFLILKQKEEAIEAFNLHKNKINKKHTLQLLLSLKRFISADKLCSDTLEQLPNSAYWIAKKLHLSIKISKPQHEILNIFKAFLALEALKPQDYALLIPSAKLDVAIENQLVKIYNDNRLNLESVKALELYVQNIKNYKRYVNQPLAALKIPSNKKVDLVYTWVDMSDKNFLETFKKCAGFYPDKGDNFQQNQVRYTNIGEINFSLKTVQSHFTEVNHIYIVTNDQIFDLSFLNQAFQNKITFVYQKDIMPENLVGQVTFDSNLIEAFLWNIEGLSETFIYSCDDYFIGAPLHLDKHVFSERGTPYAIVEPNLNLNLDFNEALVKYAQGDTKFQTFRHNANKVFLEHFEENPPFKELHFPVILSRKACEEAFNLFSNDWKDVFFKNTLRSNKSVYAIRVFLWYALQEGYQTPGPYHLYSKNSMLFTGGIDEENTRIIQNNKPLFICANFLLDQESKKQFEYISDNYLQIRDTSKDYPKLKLYFQNKKNRDFVALSANYINHSSCPLWLLRMEAQCQLQLNNIPKATRAIQRAIELKPNNINLAKIMVRVHMRNSSWEKALEVLTKNIQIQNFSVVVYKWFINVLFQLNKSEQLFNLASTLSNHENKYELVRLVMQRLIRLKKINKANIICKQFYTPDSKIAILIKILIDYDNGQLELARENIHILFQHKEFTFEDTENIPIHFIYCKLLIEQKNWELGLKQCTIRLEKFPDFLQFRMLILEIFYNTNRTKEYDELITDTYETFGLNQPWILNKYINHLQLKGKESQAIKILKKEAQSNPQIVKQLLKIYLGKGDFASITELSESSNLDTENKLFVLHGSISSYLSLGYFKNIPILIKSVLNIETGEVNAMSTKYDVLKLGIRFYNFINSPVINTSLTLTNKENKAIQHQLNEINFEFDPRKLTRKLISKLESNININFVVEKTILYLNKLENIGNAYLNTYEDPNHAYKIAKILKDKIDNKIPTSFIRLGDGEGNYLQYPEHSRKIQSKDQEDIQLIWWHGLPILDKETNLNFTINLKDAIINSDIIGIIPDRRLFRTLGKVSVLVNNNTRGIRGILGVMDLVLSDKLDSKILTSSHCHFDLETWDLYNYILSDLDKISIITCHPSLKEYITERFGIKEVDILTIPSEKKYSPLFGYKKNETTHYPIRYQEILQKITNCQKGNVFLVAAGFLGKMYCSKIKDAGGIAIDIGSIVDNWLSFKTRVDDKIPLIKNGLKFNHEIGSEIELPLQGKHTKTNHYCNKQIAYKDDALTVKSFDYLVAGHPRSGTRYISKLFGKFGFELGHERLEGDGICSWLHAASNLNTPLFGYHNIGKYNTSRYEMNPENILLLVRHPKDIIPSIILENGILLSYNYRRYHIYESSGLDLDLYNNTLEKAIVSYIEWIKLIEKQKVAGIIRLEHAQEDLKLFFQNKNIDFNSDFDESTIINRNTTKDKFGVQKPILNSADYQAINKALLDQLIEFCLKYKYDLDFLESN